jgi:hypothetical protein
MHIRASKFDPGRECQFEGGDRRSHRLPVIEERGAPNPETPRKSPSWPGVEGGGREGIIEQSAIMTLTKDSHSVILQRSVVRTAAARLPWGKQSGRDPDGGPYLHADHDAQQQGHPRH